MTKTSNTFSLMTWNTSSEATEYKSWLSRVPIQKCIPFIEQILPDIVCLQEVFDEKTLIHHSSLEKYTCITPPKKGTIKKDTDDQIILSSFPVVSKGSLYFDSLGMKTGSALWVVLNMNNTHVRIYNCHLTVDDGIGMVQRKKMLDYICRHAAKTSIPTIICGDMNTSIPRHGLGRWAVRIIHGPPIASMIINGELFEEDERFTFVQTAEEHGYSAANLSETTWAIPHTSIEWPGLKLDWILSKGIRTDVTFGPYISDHKPMIGHCCIQSSEKNKTHNQKHKS